MQKLFLEEKWEKTISAQDLEMIENIFKQTKNADNEQVRIIPIRFAVNHRTDLLCITLIHNFTNTNLNLTKVEIVLKKNGSELTSNLFEEQRLKLDAETSMPWTFIFPKGSYDEDKINGELTVDINYWQKD
ncbi:SLAP domain-containing protein [Gracilibacillus oryzae]|nr:SLAP domain-containing protein [Gracilibacillus oryzae]